MSGRQQVEHHAVEVLGLQSAASASSPAGRPRPSSRRRCRCSSRMLSRWTRRPPRTSSFLTRRSTNSPHACRSSSEGSPGPPACAGSRGRPAAGARSRLVRHRDDVDGDVAGGRVVLEPVEHAPAVDVGQADVERDGAGLDLAGQGEGSRRRAAATRALKPFSWARSSRKRANAMSSSTISSTRSPGCDVVAVVGVRPSLGRGIGGQHRPRCGCRRRTGRVRGGATARCPGAGAPAGERRWPSAERGWTGRVVLRQVEHEGAALAGRRCARAAARRPAGARSRG